MTHNPNNVTPEFREEDGWLIDANNNRASLSYWGTRETAEASLRSLKNCRDCWNCSDCSHCSGCSDCSGCSGCSDCSRCSDCSHCSGCSDCSHCSGCSDCSGCSGCSDCSRCSRCSGCSDLYYKTGVIATELGETNNGPPPVPTIPDIHQAIFAAVSRPEALDMGSWHDAAYRAGECGTTHCRGGWTVALAGEAGRKLEQFYGDDTLIAAMLIYDASDPDYRINPCRFFDGKDEALADMRQLAEKESAQ